MGLAVCVYLIGIPCRKLKELALSGEEKVGRGIMGGCVCVCAVVSSGHIAIVRKRLRFIKK